MAGTRKIIFWRWKSLLYIVSPKVSEKNVHKCDLALDSNGIAYGYLAAWKQYISGSEKNMGWLTKVGWEMEYRESKQMEIARNIVI